MRRYVMAGVKLLGVSDEYGLGSQGDGLNPLKAFWESSAMAHHNPKIVELVSTAKLVGKADPYFGKRSAIRYIAGLPLESTFDPGGNNATWTISLHNVSLGGFACWSKKAMEMRQHFFVREFGDDNSAWIAAIVRHCTRGIRGFLIGASFEDPDAAREAWPSTESIPTASAPAAMMSKAGAPAASAVIRAGRAPDSATYLNRALAQIPHVPRPRPPVHYTAAFPEQKHGIDP